MKYFLSHISHPVEHYSGYLSYGILDLFGCVLQQDLHCIVPKFIKYSSVIESVKGAGALLSLVYTWLRV